MSNQRLGVDLAGLDLTTTLQGDLALIDDIDNVRKAILRRLNTPLGSLFSHTWYGNPLFDVLSDPINEIWEGKAIAAIKECLAQEPRVKVEAIEISINPEERLAIFSITYTILGEPRSDNLVWEVPLP